MLLILVDDLRPDLGSYGHPIVSSPSIDRLAARGVRFDRAYCQFPVCNPSRSSLLTGLRPATTGVYDNDMYFRDLLPEAVTLPELFRANGYFTASFGKVFHGRKSWIPPEAWDVATYPRGRRRARRGESRRHRLESGQIGWVAAGGIDRDQPDAQIGQQAVAALEQARDRPFFIAAGFLRPHTPMVAPRAYYDLYPLDALEPPPETELEAPPLALPGDDLRSGDIPEQGERELLRAYYACISFVDAQIGTILDALDRLDLWEETVVVLSSDHGVHLGEYGWWSKNTLFEVAARVPLIVHAPGLAAAGESSEALVELVDLYPTLAELAGVDGAPPALEGRSLLPVLRDPEIAWKRAAFTTVARGALRGRSVRTDRWRYTEWDRGLAGIELYDHRADPGETVNLARQPGHDETVEELSALLR